MFCRIVINRLVMCLLSWVGNKLQEEIPTSIRITYFGVNKQIATVVVQRGKRMHRRQFHWRALRITLLAQHKPLIIIIEIYYTSCCFNGVNYYKYNAQTCSKLVRTPTVNMVSAIAMDAKLERSQFTVIYCDFHSPSPRHQLTLFVRSYRSENKNVVLNVHQHCYCTKWLYAFFDGNKRIHIEIFACFSVSHSFLLLFEKNFNLFDMWIFLW